jgi:uroporphyrinogen-III synthase
LSLTGLRIAITGSRRASELAHIVKNFGGIPLFAPTIAIEAKQDIPKEIENFIARIIGGSIDYVIFMTGPGVYLFMLAAKDLGLENKLVEALNQIVIISRSFKPKYALAKHGVQTDIVPEENTSEGIARVLKNYDIQNKKIAILCHGSYPVGLKEQLMTRGAQVIEYSIYNYSLELNEGGAKILNSMGFEYQTPKEQKVIELVEEIDKGLIDAITFTSPPAVYGLFKIAEFHHMKKSLESSLNNCTIIVAVGPSTKKALEQNSVKVDVVPKVYKIGPMIKALSDYFEQNRDHAVRPDKLK